MPKLDITLNKATKLLSYNGNTRELTISNLNIGTVTKVSAEECSSEDAIVFAVTEQRFKMGEIAKYGNKSYVKIVDRKLITDHINGTECKVVYYGIKSRKSTRSEYLRDILGEGYAALNKIPIKEQKEQIKLGNFDNYSE